MSAPFRQSYVNEKADKFKELIPELESMKTKLNASKINVSSALPTEFKDVKERHNTAVKNQVERLETDLIEEIESLVRGIKTTASHLIDQSR